jgi:hypothetical protein
MAARPVRKRMTKRLCSSPDRCPGPCACAMIASHLCHRCKKKGTENYVTILSTHENVEQDRELRKSMCTRINSMCTARCAQYSNITFFGWKIKITTDKSDTFVLHSANDKVSRR